MKLTHAILLALAAAFGCGFARSQDDLSIWKEFITMLKGGRMTAEKIRPYEQLGDKYKPILLGYLDSVRTQAAPEDWTAEPEVIRIGNRTQYVVPWST